MFYCNNNKNIIKENQQGLELLEKKLDVNEPMKS